MATPKTQTYRQVVPLFHPEETHKDMQSCRAEAGLTGGVDSHYLASLYVLAANPAVYKEAMSLIVRLMDDPTVTVPEGLTHVERVRALNNILEERLIAAAQKKPTYKKYLAAEVKAVRKMRAVRAAAARK